MTARDDSGRCSFCGRGQEESGSLFSHGEGRICAACVELAVDALDREVERSLASGSPPVRTLERQVERHRRLSDLLLARGLLNPGSVPASLVDALENVAVSSRNLETAVRRWKVGADGDDCSIAHVHVTARKVPE